MFPYLSSAPPETQVLCPVWDSFRRLAAYQYHRLFASPWFSPGRPKAEVSSFCGGSSPWEKLSLICCRVLLPPLEIFASAAVGLLAAEIVPGRVAIHFSRFFFYFYPNYTPELCLCRELNLLVSSTFSPVFKKLSLYSWTIASS